jgi:AraC-like DNA-binding protein
MTNLPHSIVEFSTDHLPEKDRIPYWREHYARIMLRADLEPAPDVAFEASITSLSLPALQLITSSLSPARISRTGKYLADGNDDIVLCVNRSGLANVTSGGREQSLAEQQAVLLSGGEAASFDRIKKGGSFTLRVPRVVFASTVVNVEDALMRPSRVNQGALRLLVDYAGLLFDESAAMDAQLLNLSVRHAHDLMALAIGPTADFAETARTRGLRASRLKLAKSHIMANSHRRDISLATVASSLGVTPRYIQRLFESDGTTFSEFLTGQRLARAHQVLCEPTLGHMAISEIAYSAGFGDLSYFNRRFRRLYGLTPRDVRGDGR